MRSSEETKLDFLLGKWTSSDRTYPGPFGPGGTSEGAASYRWEVGDKWLIYDFQTHIPELGPYEVRGGVAYDPANHAYKAYSVNSLGKMLLYEGLWESDEMLVFTLVYPQPQKDTRISYIKGPDGTVRMTSERSTEKGGREIYFETLLSR
ncbi:MAG: DUF1579 domain-containing protein [Chloroflexi bacterium]|nr:DUF1579 domain-containing protein [Chloroflexota bacterium]